MRCYLKKPKSLVRRNLGPWPSQTRYLVFITLSFPLCSFTVMPFLDVQKRLGISLDRHFIFLSAEQPYKNAARCHAFEKEWIECAHGIGATRAKKECKIEYEDFEECFLRFKTIRRMHEIKKQREKLMKEGKYTPPPHHLGKEEPRP
ncbi:rCG31129, isoform CRA_a [Rattus norvegicus]|uniref:NADH dehydrogenase [ubiquinone] iron-sulfur protein 5 n=3 Tax=Rattus norvegicus TaxID=10116 RepID=A6IS32_RAT|nr:rCG31129, isoform CRA_a [Rattus norvegicus]